MIYLHVPFCESRCTYCGFYSNVILSNAQRNNENVILSEAKNLCFESYAEAVCKEIAARREEIAQTLGVNTLYIGGGTPSVLPLDVLSKIVRSLSAFSRSLSGVEGPWSEFTIEVNPEDIVQKGEEYVKGLLALGVNRISMGVQSFDDGILRWMNRRHDSAEAVEAFRILRRCGVRNISIDLIFGLPQLSEKVWADTIERALELKPEHISAYQLSIEEDSALEKLMAKGNFTEATEEHDGVRTYTCSCGAVRTEVIPMIVPDSGSGSSGSGAGAGSSGSGAVPAVGAAVADGSGNKYTVTSNAADTVAFTGAVNKKSATVPDTVTAG